MKTPYQQSDYFYMDKALTLADKAAQRGEVPVGAIVVDPMGRIIGRGYNRMMQRHTQAAHAEVLAISMAGKKKGDWRLLGCWLYVTLEPCYMCMGLVRLSRCAGVVYGASSPLFGSLQNIDNAVSCSVYKEGAISCIAGVCQEQAALMLRKFFKQQRIKKKEEL